LKAPDAEDSAVEKATRAVISPRNDQRSDAARVPAAWKYRSGARYRFGTTRRASV